MKDQTAEIHRTPGADPRRVTLTLAGAGLLAALFIFLLSQAQPSFPPPENPLETELFLASGDERKMSMELRRLTEDFSPLPEKELTLRSSYAYLWVRLTNPDSRSRQIFFVNRNINYYTEMLRPLPTGAATLYRQGDTVPVSQSPVRDIRAVFPITVPAGQTRDVIVEYHGPRSLAVAPAFYTGAELLPRMNFERTALGLLCGAILLMIAVNFSLGILTRDRFPLAAALFNSAVFFFFLRKSRLLLLLLNTAAYPEWLFPLSIALNLASAGLLIRLLLGSYMTRLEGGILHGIWAGMAALALLSTRTAPYVMADILNFLAFPLLLLAGTALIRALGRKDHRVLWIAASFIPWILMMISDIINSYRGVREFGFTRYSQGMGLGAHIFLFTLVLLYMHHRRTRQAPLPSQVTAGTAGPEETHPVPSSAPQDPAADLPAALEQTIRPPLETIHASSQILLRRHSDPQITAVSQMVASEASALIQHLEKWTNRQTPGTASSPDPAAGGSPLNFLDFLQPQGPAKRVWLFDRNPETRKHTAVQLEAEGFSVIPAESRYDILGEAENHGIDTLIIEPASLGEEAFSLCRILRSSHNMLSLPILMIATPYAEPILRQGYASGVNDFITRPFAPSELTSRTYSLVRLRELGQHNQNLAQAEKEKNTFLFFLTHNVNTPLTILLNRIRDLRRLVSLDELQEIADDLTASSQEIHELVQNVLISFRLSDGRQPIRLDEVDLGSLIRRVEEDLTRKASEKEQSLVVQIPEDLPPARGDGPSIRGILYNLTDNAVKFSPRGGQILISVTETDALRVEVQDSGPGIPPADRSRLFQRFEKLSSRPTAGESSTGLGLFIARELARLNRGSLVLAPESEGPAGAKGGACFVLTLPLFDQASRGALR